jgi:hypothetical protein
MTDRVRKPIAMRAKVTPFGSTAFKPSAMNRNDAPQIMPGRTNNAQSTTALFMSPTMALQSLKDK